MQTLSPVQQPCDVACSEGARLASYRPRSRRRRDHATPRVLCYRHHGPQLAPAQHLGACMHAALPGTLRTSASALLPTDFSGPPLLQPGLLGVTTPHSSLVRGENIVRCDRHHGGCDIISKSEHCSLGKALLYPMGGGGLCFGSRCQILK